MLLSDKRAAEINLADWHHQGQFVIPAAHKTQYSKSQIFVQKFKFLTKLCSPIPTITHLFKGAVISDFPLVIAFSQGSNIYRPLLEKSTFIPFKLH